MTRVICIACRSVGYTAAPYLAKCECGGGLIPHPAKLRLPPGTKEADKKKSIFIPQKGKFQKN